MYIVPSTFLFHSNKLIFKNEVTQYRNSLLDLHLICISFWRKKKRKTHKPFVHNLIFNWLSFSQHLFVANLFVSVLFYFAVSLPFSRNNEPHIFQVIYTVDSFYIYLYINWLMAIGLLLSLAYFMLSDCHLTWNWNLIS